MNLAIDLGGTHLRLALGDGRQDWCRSKRLRRLPDMQPDSLVTIVNAALGEWNVAPESLSGVCVSVAAVVDEAGTILRAENLGWNDVPLQRIISSTFGRPAAVDTDIFCGALFEATHGAARGKRSALVLAIGTGIGHAWVLDGRVWRGAAGRANAFGHIIVERDGPRCYCGLSGCVCQFASGLAQSGPNPPAAALDALAQAIGAALTLFEPEIVILNGGALDQQWFDLEALAERIASFAYPGLVLPKLVRSDTADANLRGAALLLEKSS